MLLAQKLHVSALLRALAVNGRNGSSRSCRSCKSSERSTHVATGITANERMAASNVGRDSSDIFGLALRRLSPSSVSAHWNNWEVADASSIPDLDLKTSQRRVKILHSSTVTPILIFWPLEFLGL